MIPEIAVTDALAAFGKLDTFVRDLLTAWRVEKQAELTYPIDSGGLAKDLQVSRVPVFLKTLVVYNSDPATTFYLQVHDCVGTAIEGARPKIILPLLGDTAETLDFEAGLYCGNGCYVCGSTTNTSKTLITTNSITFHATFKLA